MKALAKIRGDRWLSGVSGGIGYVVGVPAWMVRMTFAALTLMTGLPLLAYVLLWVFMPKWATDPQDYLQRTQRIYDEPARTAA